MDKFSHPYLHAPINQARENQQQRGVTAPLTPPTAPAPTFEARAFADAVPGQFPSVQVVTHPGQAATLTQLPLLNAGSKRSTPDSGFDPQSASDAKQARPDQEPVQQLHEEYSANVEYPAFREYVQSSSGEKLEDFGSNSKETPPLLKAMAGNDIEPIRTLLADPDIDINATDICGASALHWATFNSEPTTVRMLLAMPHIDVNLQDAYGNTALLDAVDNFELYRFARGELDTFANANDEDELTTSQQAFLKDSEAVFLALLASPGFDINVINNERISLLMVIANRSNPVLSRMLLPVLAMPHIDINAQSMGYTALMLAADNGNDTIVRMLLAMPGIEVDLRNRDGKTALMLAREGGEKRKHVNPAQFLRSIDMLENHCVPTPATAAEVRDLFLAIFACRLDAREQPSSSSGVMPDDALSDEAAKRLEHVCARLQFGKCVAAEVPMLFESIASLPAAAQSASARSLAFGFCCGRFGNADGILHEAIATVIAPAALRRVFDETLAKLQLAAQHIDLYRIDGMNLLGLAASLGNERMIRGLVKLGAYVNLPSPNGKTALAIAVERRQWGACAELVFHGALPTLPLHDGYPALYHIVQDFCSDEHCGPDLAWLIRYLRLKGVPFDIPVKNPDDATREARPTVQLHELLTSNPRSWVKYGHIVFGLKDDASPVAPAPVNTSAMPASAAAAQGAEL